MILNYMASRDATFRTDLSGNPILASNLDYYLGIVNILFNMIPGTDPYNPEMGLDIAKYRYKAGIEGERDTEYESKINEQFSKYTDLQISTPIMQFTNKSWKVTFQIITATAAYSTFVGYHENTLKVLIDG